MNPIIRLQEVTCEYPNESQTETATMALNHLSLDIDEGSFVGIIGINGSGKSTLARHLNGLMLPTRGEVWVKGMNTREEENLWKIRQVVGMVFQNPDNQMVSAIVEDEVAFGPENLGVPPEEIRRRVDMSLQNVGMYDYRKKAPHMLSGGQKQRIAIAGVVAMLPECIVFDEPTAMLDPQGRREVLHIIETLHRAQGKTVILITHFMDEVMEADRVLVMDQGTIVMDGTPRTIFAEVETLQKLGLSVPYPTELAYRLRQEGMELPAELLSMDALAEAVAGQIHEDQPCQ